MINWLFKIRNYDDIEASLLSHQKVNEKLTRQLEIARSAPSFRSVAKTFSANDIHEDVKARVIEELAPILERHALSALKSIMRGMKPYGGISQASVAEDYTRNVLHHEFHIPAMDCVVKSVN